MKQIQSTESWQQFAEWQRKFNELLVRSSEKDRDSWNVLLRKNCEESMLELLLWNAVWQAQRTPHRSVRKRRIASLSAQLRAALSEKWTPTDVQQFHEVLDLLDGVQHKASVRGHDDFPDFFWFLRHFAEAAKFVTEAESPRKLRFDSRKKYFPLLDYIEQTTRSRNVSAAWSVLDLAFRAMGQKAPDQDALERGYRREKKDRTSKTPRPVPLKELLIRAARRGQS